MVTITYPRYQNMLNRTQANYDLAIQYYQQKESAFMKAIAAGSEDIYSSYMNDLLQASLNFNTYVLERAKQIIEKGSYSAADRKADGAYSIYIDELFKSRSRGKGGADWINMAQAGFTFEKFMYNQAMSAEQAAKVKQAPGKAINSLMTQWLESHKEFAATTGRTTFGRSDIAVGKKVTDDTVTELVNFIDLEQTPPPGVSTGDFLLQSIAQQNVDQEVYGFQLKTYQGGANDKRWQNSQVLADMITSLMNNGRTWSSQYAVNYPVYVLSKYLINIINPVNVATITPDSLELTSEMLSRYRFYMEVTWDLPGVPKDADGERGGGEEIYPRIANKTVLLRALTASDKHGAVKWKGFNAVGTKLKQSVTYDKSVKVAQIRNVS